MTPWYTPPHMSAIDWLLILVAIAYVLGSFLAESIDAVNRMAEEIGK